MAQEIRSFEPLELLKIMLKQSGIKEGIWMLNVQFGGGATNILNEHNGNTQPSFFISIESIGIVKVDEINPLAIDAATI